MASIPRRKRIQWISLLFGVCILVGGLSLNSRPLSAQDDKKAYDVSLTADNLYSFDKIQSGGDYLELTASNGQMALGMIEGGPTVVILFGDGQFKAACVPGFEEKVQQAFSAACPVTGKFTRAYLRLRPKDYENLIKEAKLTKLPDEKLLAKAKEVYQDKFLGSYHAGDKATLPPEKSIFVDLDTEAYGQVIIEDGFWLRLIRISPYKSVYPRGFEKPMAKK